MRPSRRTPTSFRRKVPVLIPKIPPQKPHSFVPPLPLPPPPDGRPRDSFHDYSEPRKGVVGLDTEKQEKVPGFEQSVPGTATYKMDLSSLKIAKGKSLSKEQSLAQEIYTASGKQIRFPILMSLIKQKGYLAVYEEWKAVQQPNVQDRVKLFMWKMGQHKPVWK